jgi:pimeloyl-ACP methyl ester carboxylesterase
MPMLDRGDGEIYYEVRGEGFPVLMLAAGALRSATTFWVSPPERIFPWADWPTALAENGYQAVVMDQRTAGQSHAAVSADHGWHTFAADQIALMDHLGHARFHVVGVCIGGSFAFRLSDDVPDRIAAQLLPQPIGFDPETPDHFPTMFAGWADEFVEKRPEIDRADLDAFARNLMAADVPDAGDFVYSVTRDAVKNCHVPTLIMPGSDAAHPRAIADELRDMLPACDWLEHWECPEHEQAQIDAGLAFLAAHTPK